MRFEVASCYTLPTQLVFVPALFLLPPQAVPVVVALALVLGKAAEVHKWHAPLGRVLPARRRRLVLDRPGPDLLPGRLAPAPRTARCF